MKTSIIGALLSVVCFAPPAIAADKEQRQMMADLRILQEQSQQLQNLLGQLNAALSEALKAVNQRLDEQTNATRRSLADQKLVIDTMSSDLRVLREKVDDNNVRVGSLGQELDALRQSVSVLGSFRPFGAENDPAASASVPVAPASGATGIGASPQKLLDGAMADYYASQYDLAILGLDSYIKTFPQSPQADYAQFHIGASYTNQGNYEKAIEAYTTLVNTYPKSSFVPDAHVKMGTAYKTLKQADKARESFEFVVKNYPDTIAATMAQQNLAPQKP